jgi:hypothetical protein
VALYAGKGLGKSNPNSGRRIQKQSGTGLSAMVVIGFRRLQENAGAENAPTAQAGGDFEETAGRFVNYPCPDFDPAISDFH